MALGTFDFWGPILAGACGALAAAGTGHIALPPTIKRNGWGLVRPGAMHWAGLVLSAGLACLMIWVGLFTGSHRADAADQMRILWGLVTAFTVGAVFCLFQMRRLAQARLEWRGNVLRWHGREGRQMERSMSSVVALEQRWGWILVRFADGLTLRLDPHARGSEALCRRIAEAALGDQSIGE